MFKQVVLLKISPWFLYADNEADALKTCSMYKDNVVGVVQGDNIIVKEPKLKMTLEQDEVFQLPHNPQTNEEKLELQNHEDVRIQVDMDEASKEIEDEFNKLAEAIDNEG